jgi:hypothetical protein
MQCPGQDNRYWDGEAVFEPPAPTAAMNSNSSKMTVNAVVKNAATAF